MDALADLMDVLLGCSAGSFRIVGVTGDGRGRMRAVAVRPPVSRLGNWIVPVDMARALSTAGRVLFSEGRGSIVVFRDLVAAVQEVGRSAWIRPLTTTMGGDVDADPADVVRRAGSALLTRGDVLALERARTPDRADRLLQSRLRDLCLAGLCGFIHAERGRFEGDEGYHDIVLLGDAQAGRDTIARVVSHAIRCAGPRRRWELRSDHPYRHLATSWFGAPSTVDAEPPEPPNSATIRARLPRDAALRTLAWLDATDAPGDLTKAVQVLVP